MGNIIHHHTQKQLLLMNHHPMKRRNSDMSDSHGSIYDKTSLKKVTVLIALMTLTGQAPGLQIEESNGSFHTQVELFCC